MPNPRNRCFLQLLPVLCVCSRNLLKELQLVSHFLMHSVHFLLSLFITTDLSRHSSPTQGSLGRIHYLFLGNTELVFVLHRKVHIQQNLSTLRKEDKMAMKSTIGQVHLPISLPFLFLHEEAHISLSQSPCLLLLC